MRVIEDRYTVFKEADLEAAASAGFISEHDIRELRRIEAMVAGCRRGRGKLTRRYIVIQDNWPMFRSVRDYLLSWIEHQPLSFMTSDELWRRAFQRSPFDDQKGNPRLSEHG